jgi:2-dehydropantoate 2-reductase
MSQWHVLGAGAIGSLFACRLQDAGMQVTLLSRHDPSPLRQLTLATEPPQTYEVSQQLVSADPGDTADISHLLVCTKAWAVPDALAAIAPRLNRDSTVVLLCNGMGLAELALPLINGASLILSSTTAGCRLTPDNTLIPAGAGRTDLGGYQGAVAAPAWLAQWQVGVPDCYWQTNIHDTLLAKVALNAVINPLTAVHCVENGALMLEPLKHKTAQLVSEVQGLLRAGEAVQIAAELPDRVATVCRQTARNHSSMRVDMEMGRRTEIEAIVGWLLKGWIANPPEMPLLSELYQTISGRATDLTG